MEFMISKGVPQRTAHHLVGALVNLAIERNVSLAELSPADFQNAHAALDESVYESLGTTNAVNAFQSYGSTAPQQVRTQINLWKDRLGLQ